MTAGGELFSRRAAAGMIVGGGIAFALSLLLSLVGEDLFPTRSAAANTFSTSAIGPLDREVRNLQRMPVRLPHHRQELC